MVERLKGNTLTHPKVLSSVDWRLHMQLGNSGLSRVKEPCAVIEFGLSDASSAPASDAGAAAQTDAPAGAAARPATDAFSVSPAAPPFIAPHVS